MRVLLATTANAGHFMPMVPFAKACLRAGHEVLVAAPGSFAASVERAGLRHRPCPDIDPGERAKLHERVFAAAPGSRNEVMVSLGAELTARSIMPGMLAAIDEWRPDVVLRELGELGSAIAAELRGVPQVQMLVGLDKFVDFTVPLAAAALAGYRETLGLTPDHAGEHLYRVPSLSLLPPSLEQPRPTTRFEVFRYRDPDVGAAHAALPDWWQRTDAPLVYATFGTVAGNVTFAAENFHTVVQSLAGLPVRLLVTVGDSGDPARWALPPNVRVERWVPQRDVLAAAAAMVCHGGTGTVLGGLAAGVPMVVVPQFADHPDNADRVAATGAGLRVGDEAKPPDPDQLRTAVHRVLAEPSFRQAADTLAAEIQALPAADEAVSLLARVAAG